MNSWKNDFFCPPKKYGIYPIRHSDIFHEEASAEEMNKNGWGGVVVNVEYTNDFPNNSSAWNRLTAQARSYHDNDLHTWIYDEKGYPSGTAGGAVLESHPECEATGLFCFSYFRKITGPTHYRMDLPEGKLFKALLIPASDASGEIIDITDTVNENGTSRFFVNSGCYWVFLFVQRRLYDSTHASLNFSEPRRYIDLCHPASAQAFIDSTYEHYAQHLEDTFGNNTPAFFIDEPSLIAWNIPDAPYALLPWTENLPEIFFDRYGYPIELSLAAMCANFGKDSIRRRCDFWELISQLVSQNFFATIRTWCESHHIAFSGHLLEEEHLTGHVYCNGSYYRCAKEFTYPGIDQLCTSPEGLMDETKLPIPRLASSVADVYGKKEIMSEASSHDENSKQIPVPFSWLIISLNWHYALGVNIITSYYNTKPYTREQLQYWNQYAARLGLALRQGERASQTAVLYPESAIWAAFSPTCFSRNKGQGEYMMRLESSMRTLSWNLLHRQIDFDYIDEQALKDASIDNDILTTHQRRYKCLILPDAHTLPDQLFKVIIDFMDNGGTVIAVGHIPQFSRETGETSSFYETLCCYQENGTLILTQEPDFGNVDPYLPRIIHVTPKEKPDITVNKESLSKGILSHVRTTNTETIVFLCNMTDSDYTGFLELPVGTELLQMDPASGITTKLDYVQHLPLHLNAYQGMVYCIQ